ncbi:hypothetical protein [Pedobacter arcticus]|uniref:hypothetical protein n=1 Tax=Pedobacter arcticus TaxID=752140 RepID=UPI0002F83007|nr:hypothetical protein [Pedobacter arcticus]
MSSLSESFSSKDREEFAKRNLKIGSVIKVFVSDTNPPKEKRLVLVGISYDQIYYASIFLNTEVNANIFYTTALKDLHVELKAIDRAYLDHDSFADCSQIQKRKSDWLLELIRDNPSKVLGELNEYDLKLLQNKIKSAHTIAPAMKKIFGLFL